MGQKHKVKSTFFFLLLLAATVSGCKKDPDLTYVDRPFSLAIPDQVSPPVIPADNGLTHLRVQLGKELFYDKALSADGSLSCAGCHMQQQAFTNGLTKGIGIHGNEGNRNIPTLTNIAYSPRLLADGGSFSLEAQVFAPLQDTNELAQEMTALVDRLSENQHYQRMSEAAYQRELSAYTITRAIAAFERTLISFNSKYDQWKDAKNPMALTAEEQQGMILFFSNRTKCASCHSGSNFTNYTYQNTGLYVNYSDPGRARITLDEKDIGKFKVPTLRNVSHTAPYMHDGHLKTLMEVIEHYNLGGVLHQNKSSLLAPLHLNTREKNSLVAFLNTLTDHSFLSDQALAPD